jgi:hypothetical protein
MLGKYDFDEDLFEEFSVLEYGFLLAALYIYHLVYKQNKHGVQFTKRNR